MPKLAIVEPDPISLKEPFFASGNFRLYHENSMRLIPTLPENSVDMIFADPPYNLSNGGFSVHAGKRVSVNKGDWDKSRGVEKDFQFHFDWIEQCQRILKPSGTIWISGTYHSIYQCGYALQLLGFKILNDISWLKPNASPNLSCRYFTASHETLIWARKDPAAKHTFNYETMREGNFPEDFIKNPGKQMRSVWAIGTPRQEEKVYGKHPTQKPIRLLDRIILASTNEGDLVVDPFNGSGTTGLAAIEHRRQYIGIDLEKEYLELTVKRFKDLENTRSSQQDKFEQWKLLNTGVQTND